jgi:hypothetical protein
LLIFASVGRSTSAAVKDTGRGNDYSVTKAAEGKEFDPLSTQRSLSHDENATQNKVMSSFGVSAGDGELSVLMIVIMCAGVNVLCVLL